MTATSTTTRDNETARRLRQFGLLEVVALTTCLALTLGLFRQSYGGITAAIVLTSAMALMLWQAKRIDRPSDVPLEFQSAALAIATLFVEWFAAWLWGFSSGGYAWLFVVVGLARLVGTGAAAVYAFGEFVRMVTRAPLSWEEQGARIGFTGRLAIAVLWVPLVFAWPMTDVGIVQRAKAIGAKAVLADIQKAGRRDKQTSALMRLKQYGAVGAKGTDEYEFKSRIANYRLLYTKKTGWVFSVETRTMQSLRVDQWRPEE